MKTLSIILLAAVVLVGIAVPVQAQTYMTLTTLAAAVNDNQTTITVASNSGFTVGNYVWMNNEACEIRAINGASITCIRGVLGTRGSAQANSDPIVTGGLNHFKQVDPDTGEACTEGTGQALYLPWINVQRNILWQCYSSAWRGARSTIIVDNTYPTTIP